MLPQFVRHLSNSSQVRRLIRALGLQKKAPSLYYRSAGKRGLVQISVGGVTGRFYSVSARDLRIVEASAHEPALTRLLANVRPDDVFSDIGVHHGLYAVLLAQKVKCVIAFEPERECYARLQQNVALNGLSNITSFRNAIGNRDAAETLYLGDGVGAINSGKLSSGWMQGAKQSIQVVCGDAFCKSEILPPPTILKIDVEGYEGSVLEGGASR